MMSLFCRFLISIFLFSQFAIAQQGTRMIFLVRHAETASAGADAGLSAAGKKRAECLAKTLKEAGIKQIFVTDSKRTQQTAAPLARALNLTPTIVASTDPNTLIRDVLFSANGNTLVVGQTDTLPFVIARMRAGTIPPIAANEYDRLFVTTVAEGSATHAIVLAYCDCAVNANTSVPRPPSSKGNKAQHSKSQ
jgi:2,3-bisphosphoglycerate-dependent phosphoglycerate mutase